MKFDQAVKKIPTLADAFRPGLQALKASDTARIRCENTQNLTGSVDVDAALCNAYPDQPRWDYAIGLKHNQKTDRAIWIEVHSASSTGETAVVIAKLQWLKRWLAIAAPVFLRLPHEYV